MVVNMSANYSFGHRLLVIKLLVLEYPSPVLVLMWLRKKFKKIFSFSAFEVICRIPTVKLKIPGKAFLDFSDFKNAFPGFFNFTVGILVI